MLKAALRSLKIFLKTFEIILIILLVVSLVILSKHNANYDKWSVPVIIATTLLIFQRYFETYLLLRRFVNIEGHYECWSYINDREANKKTTDPDEIESNGSIALIKYLQGDNLELTVTEANGNQWSGEIIMESDRVGLMAWNYIKLKDNLTPWRRNGIKRIAIYNDKLNKVSQVCIFSYQDNRFGREFLIKTGKQSD